jgi:hypothetical protein
VTALEAELLRILEAESDRAPLSAATLHRVLYATGWSPLPGEAEIAGVLEGLLAGGWCEAVCSPKLGRRYRVMRNPVRSESLAGQAV